MLGGFLHNNIWEIFVAHVYRPRPASVSKRRILVLAPSARLALQDLKVQKQRAERTAKASLQKHLKEAKSEIDKEAVRPTTSRAAKAKAKSDQAGKGKAPKTKKILDMELPEDPVERASVLQKAIQDSEEMAGLVKQVVGSCILPEKLAITKLEKDAVSRSQRTKAMQELLKQAQAKAAKMSKKEAPGPDSEQDCDDDVVFKSQLESLASFEWKGAVKCAEEQGLLAHYIPSPLNSQFIE